MKKGTQSIIILALFLIIIGIGAFLAINRGTNIGPRGVFDSFITYENDKSYKGGSGSVDARGVEDIQVNWPAGKIHIINYSGDTIQFQETVKGELSEDNQLRYTVKDNELIIQYKKSGSFNDFAEDFDGKDLEILIPEKLLFDEIEINGVSSDIIIQNVSGKSIDINSVSGDVNIEFPVIPEELDIASVSGDIQVVLTENPGFNLEYKTVSGYFSSDFPLEIKDGKNLYKNGSSEFDFSTVSGNMEIINKIS